jgi:Fe2+ transport system protein FeoA
MVRRAPFGDPIEFVVRGTHFSIRRAEAEGIRVVAI